MEKMEKYRVLKNKVFTITDREHLTADIYLPTKQTAKTDIPCMILIHGGGWKFGTAQAYAEWCIAFAERGICAMSINYRMSTPTYHGYPGVVDDVEAAINFLVDNAHEWNLDPYNMGLLGDSSGAHLAFMTIFRHEYTSAKIKLIVGAYGVYDLPKWLEYADKKWPNQPNVVRNLIGKDDKTELEYYEQASPQYIIDKAMHDNPLIQTEVFLTWGEDDGFVPAEQSIAFVEKLKQYEGRINLQAVGLEGVAHLWFPRDITCGYTNPLDKYPLSIVAPKILDFVTSVFEKPAFVSSDSNYKGKDDYLKSKTYRVSRKK
ncbi:MAG: alpha/beta hydrolase [Defluviitaleaceae bacterium]|nr:alpha/beta hydrolase [Defluviitaleaceae bacterium]